MEKNDLYEILYNDYPNSRHYIDRYKKVLNMVDNKSTIYEYHHILPKSLYEQYSNVNCNIIRISVRIHYIAHHLLWLITRCYKMGQAFHLMSTRKSSNSNIYLKYKSEINSLRKGMVPVYHKNNDNKCILIHRDKMTNDHYHILTGYSWYIDSTTNKSIFSRYDLSNDHRYISGHNNQCTPTDIYWSGDTRTSDQNAKRYRNNGWQQGLNKINSSIKALDLNEKKYIITDKLEYYHLPFDGVKISNMRVFIYCNIQFVTRISLPFFIREKYSKLYTNNDLKNFLVSGYTRSYHDEYLKSVLMKYKGMNYYDMGFRIVKFVDYKFNYNYPIVYKDMEYMNYVRYIK